MPPQPPETPKSVLADLLRQARQQSQHRSQDVLATAIGKERTTVTHAELGDKVPSLQVLNDILAATGITWLCADAYRALWRLAKRAEDPAERVAPWYDIVDRGHALRYWQPILIPGLVQTEAYAYETYRATGRDHDEATAAARARIERQQVLTREDPPTVVVVLDELVLSRLIGTEQVMFEQCARLLKLSELPNCLIHVLPSRLGASPGLGGPVALASVSGEPDALLVGSMLEDTVTTDAQQVRAASATFERVRGRAATIDDSKITIGEAQGRWTA
jgi:transcriptional regulator with XRE-family HTH domain